MQSIRHDVRAAVFDHARADGDRTSSGLASREATVATTGVDELEPYVRQFLPALMLAITVPLAAGFRILLADPPGVADRGHGAADSDLHDPDRPHDRAPDTTTVGGVAAARRSLPRCGRGPPHTAVVRTGQGATRFGSRRVGAVSGDDDDGAARRLPVGVRTRTDRHPVGRPDRGRGRTASRVRRPRAHDGADRAVARARVLPAVAARRRRLSCCPVGPRCRRRPPRPARTTDASHRHERPRPRGRCCCAMWPWCAAVVRCSIASTSM